VKGEESNQEEKRREGKGERERGEKSSDARSLFWPLPKGDGKRLTLLRQRDPEKKERGIEGKRKEGGGTDHWILRLLTTRLCGEELNILVFRFG